MISIRRLLSWSVLVLAVAVGLWAQRGIADEESPRKRSDKQSSADAGPLAQLAWMEGAWVRHQGEELLEEAWSSPEADCMVGMFRWIKEGKLWMVELMTITVDDGKPVFRLRHFDRKQTPWEKEEALTYPLKSVSDGEVVFASGEGDSARQFIFRRPDADSYSVSAIGASGKGGEFLFRRK